MKRHLISICYLLWMHLVALLGMSCFRIIQYVQNTQLLQPESIGEWGLATQSLLRGLWFDNVIGCYILLLPLTIVAISALLGYYRKPLFYILNILITTLHLLAFAISAANLSYFSYFFKNINSSIFNWADYGGTTVGMMFGEKSYWISIGLFVLISFCYQQIRKRSSHFFYDEIAFVNRSTRYNSWRNHQRNSLMRKLGQGAKSLSLSAILIGLCLFGIRGRMGYNPIRVSAAYHCSDPFLNQLGLNPTYNLLITTLDDNRSENKRIQLTDDQEALTYVQNLLGAQIDPHTKRLSRPVSYPEAPTQQNVVLIFMESLSAKLMRQYGQEASLTPFLDSLHQVSHSFNQVYSAGIHTNHGLYATLYSFPTILKRNAMKGSNIPQYSGLPTLLRQAGYQNLFFMTHEAQYDNMNAFLRTNGFDEIYAEENYPASEVVNSFGVPDHFLFDYAMPILNERGAAGKPFFATLLTISNHPPYVIPDWFDAKSEQPEQQIVEYADHCLKTFMQEAQKQPWFDNTLFVFVGDHGKIVGTPESVMPESYNHIPLMVYNPSIEPQQTDLFASQIDIAPTVLGMLRIPHDRHHLGIDLLREQRDCIFYTADDLIGCRDSSHLYIYAPHTQQAFYYNITDGNRLHEQPASNEAFERLRQHSFSILQATEVLVESGATTL